MSSYRDDMNDTLRLQGDAVSKAEQAQKASLEAMLSQEA